MRLWECETMGLCDIEILEMWDFSAKFKMIYENQTESRLSLGMRRQIKELT